MNEADRERVVKGIFKLNMTDICCSTPKWSNSDAEEFLSIITKQDKVVEAANEFRHLNLAFPGGRKLYKALKELEGEK